MPELQRVVVRSPHSLQMEELSCLTAIILPLALNLEMDLENNPEMWLEIVLLRQLAYKHVPQLIIQVRVQERAVDRLVEMEQVQEQEREQEREQVQVQVQEQAAAPAEMEQVREVEREQVQERLTLAGQ